LLLHQPVGDAERYWRSLSNPISSNLVLLGTITKPQGIKGAFRVRPISQESENLASLKYIEIKKGDDQPVVYQVLQTEQRPQFVIMRVENISTIEEARALVGCQVFAYEKDLAPLEKDTFYWYQLIGCEVITDQGEILGKVDAIIPTGANDVLQVSQGASEILLPNIPDVILNVNIKTKQIRVHLLPGLR